MAAGIEAGPKYLDQNKLYGLKPGEVTLFSRSFSCDCFCRTMRIRQKDIGVDPEFLRAQQEMQEKAVRIETSPRVDPIKEGLASMTSGQEIQGEYGDIRVEILRDPITGHRLKGFILIGRPTP